MGRRLAITLIRHGMTELNRQRAYIGWTDAPLAAAERVRLRHLKPKLPMAVDRVVSSDLCRCQETAVLLFGGRPADWWTSGWRELSFGVWEGKTFAELAEEPAYRQWLEAPFSIAPPGGESYAGFQARITQALAETIALAERSGARHIAVITHGGPIRFMLEQYAPVSRPFWEWDVPFAGGYTLDSTLERWKGGRAMHFVVGGAFQGKRKWVRERYGISDGVHMVWHDGYQEPYGLPDGIKTAKTVVFDGLEAAIRRFPDAEEWERFFCAWKQWEDEVAGRTVVWVGTDVTQGVVPTAREDRRWRDAVGICYQRLAAICCRVDRIWCGLAERLK